MENEYNMEYCMKNRKKEDFLAEEIFGINFFNWLTFWEQHHLIQKFKLKNVKITK